jgi:hypothetical protein
VRRDVRDALWARIPCEFGRVSIECFLRSGYMSPTVWIFVAEITCSKNMCVRGSNSRPPGSDTMIEGPPLPIQLYNPGDIEGVRGLFYQVLSFPLLHTSQGSTSTGLCYATPTVWTSVCMNNYTQRNMHGRGSNSRPPTSDTMMEDPPSTSPTIKLM